mgnify:CR=1 FL=1
MPIRLTAGEETPSAAVAMAISACAGDGPLAAFLTVSPNSLEAIAGLVPAGLLNGSPGSCEIKGNISINTGRPSSAAYGWIAR